MLASWACFNEVKMCLARPTRPFCCTFNECVTCLNWTESGTCQVWSTSDEQLWRYLEDRQTGSKDFLLSTVVRFLQEADVQMDSADVWAEASYLFHWLVTGSFTQHVWSIRAEQRRYRDSSRSLSQTSTFHFQLHGCRGTRLRRNNTTRFKNKWKIKWFNT